MNLQNQEIAVCVKKASICKDVVQIFFIFAKRLFLLSAEVDNLGNQTYL